MRQSNIIAEIFFRFLNLRANIIRNKSQKKGYECKAPIFGDEVALFDDK